MPKHLFSHKATLEEITSAFAGQRKGSYTILYATKKYLPGKNHEYVHFVCQCDCGRQLTVIANAFKKLNKCPSCCQVKHGKSYTKLYKSYTCMKERCYYPHNNRYYAYGARGIKICDEWLNDKNSFFEWALKNGYKEGLSIDRIDVNGDYCPGNCRWATRQQQANNTRRNVKITFNGQTKNLSQWAKQFGLKPTTIKARLQKGWSVEEALTKNVKKAREFVNGGDN